MRSPEQLRNQNWNSIESNCFGFHNFDQIQTFFTMRFISRMNWAKNWCAKQLKFINIFSANIIIINNNFFSVVGLHLSSIFSHCAHTHKMSARAKASTLGKHLTCASETWRTKKAKNLIQFSTQWKLKWTKETKKPKSCENTRANDDQLNMRRSISRPFDSMRQKERKYFGLFDRTNI